MNPKLLNTISSKYERETEKVWLSPPHMGGQELKYIHEAFESNWIAPLGPNVDAFEKNISLYTGSSSVAALSSGTAALHLSLILSGVTDGDEVLVPSFTFSASANPILYERCVPIFVDSEVDSWNISPDFLEEAILDRIKKGKKPKVLISAHIYGMPYDVTKVHSICNKYDIKVIEDAAEALGSKYDNQHLGTFGLFGALSFNGNKIITTSGGGALISNDSELIEKARFLSTQARDRAPHYQHSHIGYNYRLSNVLAGIGIGQLEVINDRVKTKREIYSRYIEILSSNPNISFSNEPSDLYYSNRWLAPILINFNDTIDLSNKIYNSKNTADNKTVYIRELVRETLESLNIEARPLWKPLHLQPIFAKYPYYGNRLSEKLFDAGLCIPSGTLLTESKQSKICSIINDILATIC